MKPLKYLRTLSYRPFQSVGLTLQRKGIKLSKKIMKFFKKKNRNLHKHCQKIFLDENVSDKFEDEMKVAANQDIKPATLIEAKFETFLKIQIDQSKLWT